MYAEGMCAVESICAVGRMWTEGQNVDRRSKVDRGPNKKFECELTSAQWAECIQKVECSQLKASVQ